MSTPNERFREIRKACKKTQEEWGAIIGISRGGVTEIESGRRNVTEKHLVALKNFSEKEINVDWIRSGNGEMFVKITRSQEIGDFANNVMDLPDKDFKKRFVEALSKLDEKDWEVLEKIVDNITKEG